MASPSLRTWYYLAVAHFYLVSERSKRVLIEMGGLVYAQNMSHHLRGHNLAHFNESMWQQAKIAGEQSHDGPQCVGGMYSAEIAIDYSDS